MCAALGDEVLYLRLLRADRVVGLSVATAQRTRWRTLGRLRDGLSLNSPPAVAPEVARGDAIAALEAFGRSRGFARLSVGSYADPRPDAGVANGRRTRLYPRLEFRLALGADFAATLARMHVGHRRNLRKVAGWGFEFSERTSLEGAMTLHSLHEETFERRRSLGNAQAHGWPRASYERTMQAAVRSGAIRIFFASREQTPLSGIGVLEFGKSAYYFVGGTTRAGYQCHAAFAMFASTIERLIAHGFTELNLGGVPLETLDESHTDHGLYRFKAGFGSQVLRLSHRETRLNPWSLSR